MGFKIKKIQATGEIASIEFLRGIASLMVCFFHLSWGNETFLSATNPIKIGGTYGWSGVEIFFVISGFVIPYAMFRKNYTISNFSVFLKKRLIRIEPPYIVSILLVLGLNFLSTLSPYYRGLPFTIDWSNVFGHIAYINVFTKGSWLNPVYWSLAIELQYYLLIAFLFFAIVSNNISYRIVFFMMFASSAFLPLPSNRFIFEYSAYFLAGIVLFQWVCKIIDNREFGILLGSIAALIWIKNGLMLMLLTMLVVLTITYVNEIPRIFRYFGLISYSLYLIHVPIGGKIINLSVNLIQSEFLRGLIVFFAMGVCILAAAIFYKYIENIFKKIAGEIKYRKESVFEKKAVVTQ